MQYRKIVQEATFVSATTSETALYIFNYSKGFVVISDDKRLLPILALSDKGSFDNNTQHLGVQDWVASAKKVITTAREEKLSQSKTTAAAWE